MKTVKIHHPYRKEQIIQTPVVLVLGFFDGIHLGHQAVINEGRKIADERGLKLALMTFNHHPSIVFKKLQAEEQKYLASLSQKETKMVDLGVDFLYEVEFTSAFAKLPPQDFVDEYIVALQAQVVVTGFDYTYGPKEIADIAHLPEYAKGRFEIVTVDKKEVAGEKVSSTRIREMLAQGAMEMANELLGYVYETEGVVIHGEARGRLLGFPTANVQSKRTVRLPKEAVYVCEIKVAGKWYPAMGSIGHNDTFGDNRELTVEIYILNFKEEIYGEQVSVRWHQMIREQVKFDGAEALIQQLKEDEETTRLYFEG
ncbi:MULTISPECIES: riboflavin biosynthesis protein RibF [unclassified Enterococcus]|uniref:riboflavin biosynthesis protein RibF n=1 Tax=unclassified Enterococcus TaxID=2608891 RepID=UPI00247471C7|nr:MULTISPECIES: riboflavin biosynthesis protein RibF [unclassified Enterococcus]